MKTALFRLLAAMFAVTALFSCTEVTNLEPEPEPEGMKFDGRLVVSVGAGIADAATKSEVAYDAVNHTRTLKFTDADRLWVRANLGTEIYEDYFGKEYYRYVVAGYLNIDALSISNDGTRATFNGELTVYEAQEEIDWSWDFEEDIIKYHYDDNVTVTGDELAELFNNPGNALAECTNVEATLVHADASTYFRVFDDLTCTYDNYLSMDTDVETLMTTRLMARGNYNNGSFALSAGNEQPIFNCVVSGLTPGVAYDVVYLWGSSSYKDFKKDMSTVTADDDGNVTFAYFGWSGENIYHALRFKNKSDEYDWKLAVLGQKTLANKVYNVTRTVVVDPDTPVPPSYTAPAISILQGSIDYVQADGKHALIGNYYYDEENYVDVTEPCSVTLSGTSIGCYFTFDSYGDCNLVTLDNLTATYDGTNPFINSIGYLELNITGDNTITCKKMSYCISADNYIDLTGSGKLTIIVSDAGYHGMYGCGFYINNAPIEDSDWPVGTENADGTWTFVFNLSQY